VTLKLPPEILGCWQGESVLEDTTLVHGQGAPDLYTSAVFTLCYHRRGSGSYELQMDRSSALVGSNQGTTSLVRFLMTTRMLKVDTQISDVKLKVVPQDEDNRFQIQSHENRTIYESLLGIHAQATYRDSATLRCQVRSRESVYCQVEVTNEKSDGTWVVLGHSHVELSRVGTETKAN
jgi:hypothetical protein